MATPQQLREETALVAAQALAEMRAAVDGLSMDVAREALLDVLPGLIEEFANAAAVVAADWYDDFRSDLQVPGSYKAFIPDLRDPGVDALIGWARQEADSALTELNLLEGGVQRRVVNGSRDLIIANTKSDPRAIGHQRYRRESRKGCGFCKMLAARGTLYRTASSASFGAHDACQCVAVPAWGGVPIPVRPYTPSTKNITDADRARLRAWLRKNPPA